MTPKTLTLAALALFFAGSSRVSAEDAEGIKDAKALLAEMDAIAPQIEAELALYREQVQAGKEEDGWTEQRKIIAMKWLDGMTPPKPNMQQDANGIQRLMSPAFSQFMFLAKQRSAAAQNPSLPPQTEISEWLGRRIDALLTAQASSAFRYGEQLIPYVEEIWSRSRTTADLQPAEAAMMELKSGAPSFFRMDTSPMAMMMAMTPPNFGAGPNAIRMSESLRLRVGAYEAWLLTGLDEPLILPDPETEPEDFWKARVIWQTLRQDGFAFVEQPRVAAHFNALDRRFREASIAAGEQLDQLILQDAPAEKLAPAIQRLHAFEVKRFNFQSKFPKLFSALDMRRRMRPMFPRAGFRMPEKDKEAEDFSKMLGSYERLLELRQAEESGQSHETVAALQEALLEPDSKLSEAVKLHLHRKLLPPPPAATPEPSAPDANPVTALIAELEKLAGAQPAPNDRGKANIDGFSDPMAIQAARSLLAGWQAVSKGDFDVPVLPQIRESALLPQGQEWGQIAMQPGSLKLLTLRDDAARILLARMMGSKAGGEVKSETLPNAMRGALEKSAVRGEWKLTLKIRALESAAGVFSGRERTEWQQTLDALITAEDAAKRSPSEARGLYFQILGNTTESSFAALAARRLKELPATEEQP